MLVIFVNLYLDTMFENKIFYVYVHVFYITFFHRKWGASELRE